jgi:phosphoglucosamine mutase
MTKRKAKQPKQAERRKAPRSTQRQLFGTDGIRGKANEEPMTSELALRLGRAIAIVAYRHAKTPPRIVIGKDTRLSGYMLETALASGICANGGFVQLSGPIPTPAVANLTQSMRAHAGVVISASHNPYEDNGIKIFGPDGFKLPDAEEAAIEALMGSKRLTSGDHTGAKVGRAERISDAVGRYIVFAKNTFPRDLTLHGVKVVVDGAHGAAYKVGPAVFEELGATVTSINCKPNGRNINANCGALHPEAMAAEVKKQKAHLGVALDGDADRVIIVDEHGEVVDGDALMALCASRMLKAKTLNKRTLVATVMSNMGLEHALEKHGGKLLRTAVGDRYVVEEMRAGGYNFGGEQSGHLVFLDHATTGDGIVAALQVLAVMVREQKPLSHLRKILKPVPQVLENVSFPKKKAIDQMPKLSKLIAQIEKKLGKQGRVLVRWSGTEPKLRLMLEGPKKDQLKTMIKELSEAASLDIGG